MIRKLVLVALCSCAGDLAAATAIERSHPIESNGAVRVDIGYGRVRIVGSQPGHVRVTGEIDDKLSGVRVGDEAGAVEIRARFGWLSRLRALRDGPSTYHVDLLVEVPRDARLFVVSRDADITIEGIDGPIGVHVVSSSVVVRADPAQLDLEAVSGSLDFEGRTQHLKASTLTGDLRVVGPEGDLRLDAATGSLEVLDVRLRSAELSTVSGAITVRGSIADGGLLDVTSQSGEVRLECCDPGGAELDLETSDGEILNEMNDTKPIRDANGHRSLKLTLEGTAGGTARVRTRSGLIWIRSPSEILAQPEEE